MIIAGSAVSAAGGAAAQAVEIQTLAAPDAFSTPGRDTGLPATLWRGASLQTARAVLPLLATRTLTPTGAALARRVLATGATGPQGAGSDPVLIAARASALLAQGDAKAAAAILSRAPGLDRSPELAHVAAETALLAGDDARACSVAEGLSSGRDEIYWLRLRTYCQAIAGHPDQAQLTFDLAQSQAKDVTFGRLMGAKLAGASDPGAASLRNGLDYALSRSLGLDLAAAKPSPAVAAALSAGPPGEPHWSSGDFAPDLAGLAGNLIQGEDTPNKTFDAFLGEALSGDAKVRARNQAASLLIAMVTGEPLSMPVREKMVEMSIPEGRMTLGRAISLEAAAEEHAVGEVGLLVLWACAEASSAGLSLGDRVRMVHALERVGLKADARNFALEGLLALK